MGCSRLSGLICRVRKIENSRNRADSKCVSSYVLGWLRPSINIYSVKDKKNAEVLDKRCRREFPNRKVKIITGDANASIDNIIEEMPRPGKSHKVLGFCFLDPFQMQNLYFSTIRTLSQRFMDFLVLIPSSMDAHRNEQHYVHSGSKTLENFIGNPDWRTRWVKEKTWVSRSKTLSLKSLVARCRP